MLNPIAIEGDFLETKENGLIFDVKGLIHPKNKIICFLRYYPDSNGERVRKNTRYSKIYDLKERYDFLKKKHPEYIFNSPELDMDLQGVNIQDLITIYKPNNCFKSLKSINILTKNQQNALDLCDLIIDNSQLDDDDIGISGSIMVGLDKDDSDIDLIIYGTESGKNLQGDLMRLYNNENNSFRMYNLVEYKKHYEFRAGKSNISFEDFMKSEERKLHNAKFHGTDVFIRYIKSPQDWPKKFTNYRYKNYGRIKIEAEVIKATDSIYTPCTYEIKTEKLLEPPASSQEIDLGEIREISSYRGRFCEQAQQGDRVLVEGKIEKVIVKNQKEYFRLQLGESDYDKMIIL